MCDPFHVGIAPDGLLPMAAESLRVSLILDEIHLAIEHGKEHRLLCFLHSKPLSFLGLVCVCGGGGA